MERKQLIKDYIEENMDAFVVEELQEDDNIFEKGFVQSIFAVQLLSFIESTFDVSISDDDIQLINFSTINNIDKLIAKTKGEQ